MKKGLIILGTLLILCGLLSLLTPYSAADAIRQIWDKEAPILEVLALPEVIGPEQKQVRALVKENLAGIDEIIVLGQYGGKSKTLIRNNYSSSGKSKQTITKQTITVDIVADAENPSKDSSKDYVLHFSAYDRSYWKNKARLQVNIPIDLELPSIETLSVHHNMKVGGSGFVVYRLKDKSKIASTGVKVGSLSFPAYPLEKLGTDEAVNDKMVYFCLFAVPLEFDKAKEKIAIFAKDIAGNRSEASFRHSVRKKRLKSSRIKLEPEKFESVAAKFFPDTKQLGDLTAVFQAISGEVRDKDSRRLIELLQKTNEAKAWDKKLLRQKRSTSVSAFGSKRTYIANRKILGTSTHLGVDLASINRSSIRAAAAGTVVFAGNLGLYGQTIIVDHGFGLATLYAHLSKLYKRDSDQVTAGETLGLSGTSGFSFGDHLHFEVRVHGVPVDPIEWWDQRWVRDHVLKKLDSENWR